MYLNSAKLNQEHDEEGNCYVLRYNNINFHGTVNYISFVSNEAVSSCNA